MSQVFAWISTELSRREAKGLKRELRERKRNAARFEIDGQLILNLAGNDYLGLGSEPWVEEAAGTAAREYGSGAGASRLLSGNLPVHLALEDGIRKTLGSEQALVFSSGYLANLGVVSSLVQRGDFVVADKHSHASLLDGILLSRAHLHRFRHNSLEHLDETLRKVRPLRMRSQKLLVVTESLFSMDGDIAPLHEISLLAAEHSAMLLVDESHSVGLFGRTGGGLCSELGLAQDGTVVSGSLGKAFASAGGFVSGPGSVRELLINTSRSFIFNTAPTPAQIGAANAALTAFSDLGRRRRLFDNISLFRSKLQQGGLEVSQTPSPIVPIPVRGNEACLTMARRLFEQGLWVAAIRSPTVAPGKEMIRVSLSAAHNKEEIAAAAETIIGLLHGSMEG